jgi:hypothetical protein
MPSSIAVAQPQHSSSDLDHLLALVTSLKAQQKVIQAELDQALDQLTDALERGDIDPSFSHDDWRFSYSKGRTTVTYSDKAKAAIKTIQEADLASGRAIQKEGAGFWTIKAPSL